VSDYPSRVIRLLLGRPCIRLLLLFVRGTRPLACRTTSEHLINYKTVGHYSPPSLCILLPPPSHIFLHSHSIPILKQPLEFISLAWPKIYHSALISGSSSPQETYTHIFALYTLILGARGSIVVKALCYKQEGRGFVTR
jgi:hypothetical protein